MSDRYARPRKPPVKAGYGTDNAKANRQALKLMPDCQIQTGLTADELRAIQLDQKARLLAKKAA